MISKIRLVPVLFIIVVLVISMSVVPGCKQAATVETTAAAAATTAATVETTAAAAATTAAAAETTAAVAQVYREGWFAEGGPFSSFITTGDHRLDITVNEPLVANTWQGGMMPLLAESYEMKEGGKVWLIHLRKGVKWHDGIDFTAEDVVFSYNAYANPAVSSIWSVKAGSIMGFDDFQKGKAKELTGIKVIDPYTVEITLSTAMPLWMKIEQNYLVIFPKHLLGDIPPDKLVADPYWHNRIGTGPFKWSKFVPDQYIELVRNDDYYLGAPKLEKLIYQMYAQTETMVSALIAGEIDMTAYEGTVISAKDAADLAANNPNLDIVAMEKGSPAMITLNQKREWKDVRLRQAIRYAIDVDSMLASIYPGAKPAYTLFPQDWTHPEGLNTYKYDPEKAKQLIKDAGWSGRSVDFIYYFGDEQSKNLVAAIQQYLAAVGIDVKPRLVEGAAYNTAENKSDFDMGLVGQGMALDPSGGEFLIQTGRPRAFGYSNPTIDELLTKGKSLASQEERAPIYQEISKILNEEMPQVYLWYDIRYMGFNKNIVGPREHYKEQKFIYFNMPVYNEIEKWYVSK